MAEDMNDLAAAFGGGSSSKAPNKAVSASTPAPLDDLGAAFKEGSSASADRPVTAGGVAGSAGVGFNRGLATLVGAPVDVLNWGMGKVGLPVSETPFGGSESIKKGLGLVGANPDDARAKGFEGNAVDRFASTAGEGVAMAMLPEMAAANIVRSGLAKAAPRTVGALGDIFGTGSSTGRSMGNALAGGTGAVGGKAASDALPEDSSWRPMASLLGGMASAVVPAAVGAGVKGAWDAGQSILAKYKTTTRNPEAAAGSSLRAAAQNPEKIVADYDPVFGQKGMAPANVAGSKPTTFQETGDMGLGEAERAVAAVNPGKFMERRGEQNSARLAALDTLEREGTPESVGAFLRQRMADIEAKTAGPVAQATERAQRQASDLVTGQTPESFGEDLRGAASAGLSRTKAAERALWDAVDPENNLVMPATTISETARGVVGRMTESATPMSGEEARLFGVATGYKPTMPFRSITDLRSAVNSAMAEAKDAGNTMAYGRLTQLRGSIENAIENAAAHQAAVDETAIASGAKALGDTLAARVRALADEAIDRTGAGEGAGASAGRTAAVGSPENSGAAGSSGQGRGSGNRADAQGVSRGIAEAGAAETGPGLGRVYHPGGNLDVRYELAELPSLVTSHDTGFRPRSDFPHELQPRARESAPAQDQVNAMAARLQPERLGRSAEANSGAPIVGPDNVVESGNGRTLAIAKVYEQGRDQAYRDWLESQGFDTSGLKQPVLVARRVSDLDDAGRVAFAHSANTSTGLRMNAAEQATADAKLITPQALDALAAEGGVAAADSRAFVRDFLSRLPASERGAFLDANGSLSQQGIRRLDAAVASRAFDDEAFIARAFDAADPNIKGVAGALTDVAGPWARMRAAAQSGEIDAAHDVTSDVMKAAKSIMRARDEGRPVAELMNQRDMFGGEASDLAKQLLLRPDGSVASRRQIAENLQRYAEEAQRNLAGPQLFGDAPSPVDVLKTALGKRSAEVEAGSAPAAFAAIDEPASVSRAMQPDSPPAKFDSTVDQRIKAASAARRDRAVTYEEGPVGDILKKDGRNRYDLMNSEVPQRIFVSGPKGAETIAAYRKAVGDGPALKTLGDYVSSVAARETVDNTGVVNPKNLAAFTKRFGEALRAFPELQAKFASAAKATEAIAEATAARKAAVDAAQDGKLAALMKLDDPADIVSTIGGIFGVKDSVKQMRIVADAVKGDPEAKQGLRRAVADHIAEKFIGNTEAATSGENLINSNMFQTFVRKNSDALKLIFSKEEMNTLNAIAADLHQANRSLVSTKLPGGSNTAQDTAAILKRQEQPKGSLLSELMQAYTAGAVSGGEGGSKIIGGLLGVAGVGARKVLGRSYVAGQERIAELFRDALLDPHLAARLMAKAPIKEGTGSHLALGTYLRRKALLGGGSGFGATQTSDPDPMREPEPLRFTVKPRAAAQ